MGVSLSSCSASRGKRASPVVDSPASEVAALPTSSLSWKAVPPLGHVGESLELKTLSHTARKGEDNASAHCALSRTASGLGTAATIASALMNEVPTASSCSDVPPYMSDDDDDNDDSESDEERRKTATQTPSRTGHYALHLVPSDAAEGNASFSVPLHSRRASRSLVTTPTTVYGVDVVQIESATPLLDGLQLDLDDFELAYSRGVQDGNLSAAAAESFAAVQYIRPLRQAALRNGAAALLSHSGNSATTNTAAAPDSGTAYPHLYTLSEVDETLAFVTLRRAGFAVCRICATDLPFNANYCPECGTQAEASCNSPVTDSQYTSAGTSHASSPLVSSLVASPNGRSSHYPTHHSSPSTAANTPRLGHTVESRLQESNVFTLQRGHAYVRYVKVLRSREILGAGTSGTVYRAIDTRSGQQLAVKESLINQNAPEELAAVRNELRQLAELRHPYIIEYLGCRVEAVEDVHVSYFQSSLISSHASAVESRRTSRRNSVASPRAAKDSRSASMCDESALGLDAGAAAVVMLDLPEDDEGATKIYSCSVAASPTHRRRSVTMSSSIRVLMLMERVECGTLTHLLHEFPRGMPEQAVRRFVAQLVDAVRYVHSCELSHRDIKPDNILLASDGTIRLSDFGCAVRGVGGFAGSKRHSIAGTPAYMPPESLTFGQTSSSWTSQGKAQDVWAVGCVVHHLLTAEAPWSSVRLLSPYALMLHVQSHEFPMHTTRLSRDAQDFCRRCFERDPQRRITAMELATHPFVSHAQNKNRSTSSLRFSQSGW